MEVSTMKGMIKRLIKDRGFGFIREDETENEYFFHRDSCVDDNFELLSEGNRVSFTEGKSPKGLRAADVTLVD